MDEEQLLLDKLGRGDVDALDTLYVRYAPKVYDFSLRFLKNEAEAEDVTQDIFLQVWDNRSLMGQVVSIRAYLFRMTRNTIFNRFKRSKMHLQYIRQSETREAELSVDPGRRITTEDLLEMIELAIENLPEQCRRVFKMSRYEHLSYNEIAERLGHQSPYRAIPYFGGVVAAPKTHARPAVFYLTAIAFFTSTQTNK